MKNKLLVICGPTASGKTALAATIARQVGGELVSADSRQIYIGMDIGTGKDLPQRSTISSQLSAKHNNKVYTLPQYTLSGVPIWMYDVVHPNEEFSVSHYQQLAGQVLEDIVRRRKVPIIVGGTGLYIQSLITPFDTADIGRDTAMRKELESATIDEMRRRLHQIAPGVYESMNHSDQNNIRRLIRKIEIAESKKHDSKSLDTKESRGPRGDILQIGLCSSWDQTLKRIRLRVDTRMRQGMLTEVQRLLSHGYTWDLPAMSSLGYRQLRPYFEKEKALDMCVLDWVKEEYAYAKRQMVWFKKDARIRWFDPADKDAQALIQEAVDTWYTTDTYDI